MIGRLRTLVKAPRQVRRMLAESFFLSAYFRFLIARRPFRQIARLLGRENLEADADLTVTQTETARSVQRAIAMISGHTPWRFMCLEQAFVAKNMLSRRGVPCTVYLGVRKDPAEGMIAHAWTRCGGVFVTGGTGHGHFTITGRFS